jgi:hypothetical protein
VPGKTKFSTFFAAGALRSIIACQLSRDRHPQNSPHGGRESENFQAGSFLIGVFLEGFLLSILLASPCGFPTRQPWEQSRGQQNKAKASSVERRKASFTKAFDQSACKQHNKLSVTNLSKSSPSKARLNKAHPLKAKFSRAYLSKAQQSQAEKQRKAKQRKAKQNDAKRQFQFQIEMLRSSDHEGM